MLKTSKRKDLDLEESVVFENQPPWIVIEQSWKKQKEAVDIKLLPTYLIINKIRYNLLCMYNFDSINHFRGIYLLNEKYYMINDLTGSAKLLDTNDHIVSAFIFYKTEANE